MSGKHDKSVDEEQSANLLLTGPIAIRGLGRGVKDALVRGRLSRHRAFAADGTEYDVDPTPLQQMLATGPTVGAAGPSSDLAAHGPAGSAGTVGAPALSSPSLIEARDDPQEAPVDDRAGKEASVDDAAQATEVPVPNSAEGAVDDWAATGPAAPDARGARETPPDQPSTEGDGQAEPGHERTEPADGRSEPVLDASSDEFDALPAEESSDGQPVASDDVEQAAPRGPEVLPEAEQAAASDQGVSDEGRSIEAADVGSEPIVGGSSDVADALPTEPAGAGTEAPSPTPGAVPRSRADDGANAAEPVSDREVASLESSFEPTHEETADAASDGAIEEDQPTPEDPIELLEAEQTAGRDEADGERFEALTGEFEGEFENEDAGEGLPASRPDTGDSAEVGSESEASGPEASAPEQSEDVVAAGSGTAPSEPEALTDASTEKQQTDGTPEPDQEPGQQSGEAETEHSSEDSTLALAASEFPGEPTDHQRDDHAEAPSNVDSPASATAGTPDEHEISDEAAVLPEARPLPVEIAAGASQVEPGDEVAPADAADGDQQPEPEPVTEQPMPSEDAQGRGSSDGAQNEQQRATAEEFFGLPPQLPQQDGAVDAADRLVEDSAAPGGHLGAPEPAGGAPAEQESTPEAATSEPEPEPGAAESETIVAVAAEPPSEPEQEPEQRAPAAGGAAAAPVALATAWSDARPSGGAASSRPPRPPSRPRPMRERFGREAIGIAVLVVLALICAGLITAVVIKTRHDAAIAASEAAHYTPPPLATPEPTPTPTPTSAKAGPAVAVIGDATTTSAASGVTSKQRWTSVLASSLGGAVSTDASNGMGYAAKGTSGETFVQAARKVASDANVVVFFGGAADSNIAPLSLATAATDAFAAAKLQAPKAKILVVGPAVSGGVGTAGLTAVRSTLRSAAAVVKATWIDPLDGSWLPPAKQTATPADLSASDQSTIASKMQDAVKKALG